MNTHQLLIAGHRLTVRSPADEAYVQTLAAMLDERVRGASDQGAGPVGAVLIAALGLADELMKTREREARLRDDVGRHAQRLAAALDVEEADPAG